MKILVFTEGTLIMHRGGIGHTREEIVIQVKEREKTIHNWALYVPISRAVEKSKTWQSQGVAIAYLTSRTKSDEVEIIKEVLNKHDFADGQVLFRRKGQQYKGIAEKLVPDILIEDDRESIGGVDEMTITHVKPEIKAKIESIPVKEFGGINHLPNEITALKSYNGTS